VITLGTPILWASFIAGVAVLVAIDLRVTRASGGVVSAGAAARWVGVYILLALGFSGFLYTRGGTTPAVQFLTAYVIEYALSVDNLFVFLVIFAFFKVRPAAQHRLLYWGVLGAVSLRATLIFLGTALVTQFTWILYIFGAFLLYTAWKLLFAGADDEVDPEQNAVLRIARKFLPVAKEEHGDDFTAKENGKSVVTRLFLVLLVVETSDLLFALDSIPAVLGISKDPFVIFTSNVMAVMGLRSLFFVVSSLMDKFHYLKVGLSVILAFVGLKLIGETYFAHLVHEHEGTLVLASLGFIGVVLTVSIVASVLRPPKAKAEPAALPDPQVSEPVAKTIESVSKSN
jgi:tellurite resistance protein TerC